MAGKIEGKEKGSVERERVTEREEGRRKLDGTRISLRSIAIRRHPATRWYMSMHVRREKKGLTLAASPATVTRLFEFASTTPTTMDSSSLGTRKFLRHGKTLSANELAALQATVIAVPYYCSMIETNRRIYVLR